MPDTDIIGTKYREDTEMKKSAIALTAALMMAAAPAFAAAPNDPSDYPTTARVYYVIGCIATT